MSHSSYADERFSFLEIADPDRPLSGAVPAPLLPSAVPAPLLPSFSVPEIPANQHLNYLDLLALRPMPALLRQVSRRLIEKYQFIPISTQPTNLPLRLPRHLDAQFHWRWKNEGPQICYLAICPPDKELILQLISNAVGHGIYALPIKEDTFARFMQEKYTLLKKS